MTSRVTEIQTLIADIDELLTNKGKRLPRVLSNQDREPRQVLQRIRDFLTRLTESEAQAYTNNPRRSTVNLCHHGHLLILLVRLFLIYTNSVNP